MANQKKQAPAQAATQSPLIVVLSGAIFLVIGLIVGYYFGRQAAPASAGAAPVAQAPSSASGNQSAMVDPMVLSENESRLKTSLGSNPKDLNALIQLGNLYYDSNRFGDAVDYYGRALDLDPRNVSVRTDRGTSYWSLGQADAAIAEFQKSLAVDPSHGQTLYNLGVVYLHGKNNPAEARKTWERLLATNPNYPERSKVQAQIDELRAATGARSEGQGVEDLLQRMKSRQ